MARKPVYPGSKPSVGRRVAKIVVGLVITAVMLGGALVLVDMGLRDFAESRAESEIKRRVPGSAVSAQVEIGGFSMLQQFVQGELDDVDATFTLGGEGLDRLADNAGYAGSVDIVDGAIQLATEVDALGVVVPFSVSLEPTLDDAGYLVLTATGIQAAEGVTIDLTPFVDLATVGIKVCSASLLPESIELTGVEIDDDRLTFTAHGSAVPTNFDALSARGECVDPEAPVEGDAVEPPVEG
jgi:hypothetical protein